MPLPTQSLSYLVTYHARTRPQQPAFSTTHQSTTFAALATKTQCLAAHLNCHEGTCHVAIVLPRCIEFVESILAITRASRVGVPLDPRASIAELRYALCDCEARIVFTNRKGLEKVRAALKNITGALIVVVNALPDDLADEQIIRVVRYEEWTEKQPPSQDSERASVLDRLGLDEPAWLHYTSGTTGTPKGVLSSQRAWLVSAANYAEALGITASDRLFWPLPLYHAFGHSLCIIGTMVVGASVFLMGHNESILARIQSCNDLTIIAGVPSTYHELAIELAQKKDTGTGTRLPQPRICVAAGGTTPTVVKANVEDAFGASLLNNYGSTESCGPIATAEVPDNVVYTQSVFDAPLLNRYGCTESCGAIVANRPDDPYHESSCGAPLPHIEVEIARFNTSTDICEFVADGEEGEIWIRGPSMMLKYWSSRQQQQQPFTDAGWYRTGDLGRRLPGSAGHISVTGRLKELIRRGSETIHPAEVERVICSCPGVKGVVVTGVPHDMLGETAAAFIVRASQDADIDVLCLLAACRATLPDYKVPTMFFEIEDLPRTKAGKLRRRAALDCQRRPLNARFGLTKDRIAALVVTEVRAVCGIPPEEHLDISLPFVDLGMNSLAGVVLRDRLASLTGLEGLPSTLVFDQPTPFAVSDYLWHQLSSSSTSSTNRGLSSVSARSKYPLAIDDPCEPIAIISMDCRYPGKIDSPASLWDVVASGTDVTSRFPSDRGWNFENLFSSDSDNVAPGTSVTDRGGFLADMAHFDTSPFKISPREALAVDPQQRLLLEVTWHLAERARIAPSALRGSSTGVFVGVMYSDYAGRFLNSDSHGHDAHLSLGSAGSVAAGRISYTFGLQGPCIAIDTACSSSTVAIDLAAKSLRSGECALAIAGGVTIMATPRPFIMFSRQGGLAPDGRCKSYSAAADGTAWSEGVGLLMLERLSDAKRNGHEILGLVRGSAVNSDGASNGLTAPNGAAQERVIQQALTNAGIRPEEVDVLEGHGTATTLGDAIEVQAVLAAYGNAEREFPLLLGSIKSNIGHTQAASGVAGVIKMVQALQHGMVPQSLHAERPSTYIGRKERVELASGPRPWPERKMGGPRRAAVSSFGIGGTNSHIILEEHSGDATETLTTVDLQICEDIPQKSYPWLLSSATEAGMRAQAQALLDHNHEQEFNATDVAFSLATTRSFLPYRAAVISGRNGASAYASPLRAIAQDREHSDVVIGLEVGVPPRLVFMFSGQASLKNHSLKGIKDLCASFPAFDTSFKAICHELDSRLVTSLSEVVRNDLKHLVKRADLSQAIIFALEVAMFRLLESFDIHPDAVVGHSVGEIAAAHVAGYLSLPSAAALISTRGKLMAELPEQGAMASISASAEDIEKALDELTGREGTCAIAAVNASSSVVVSGSVDAVTAIMDVFINRGRPVTLLEGVDRAFHSPFMDSMLNNLSQALYEDAVFCNSATRSTIPLVSTVTGKFADATQLASPEYWTSQVRAAVRFADAVGTLTSMGAPVFLEIGPSAPLSVHVPDAISTKGAVNTLLEALGRLWVCGVHMKWEAAFQGSGARAVHLPVYHFQRRRYWLDPPNQFSKTPNTHHPHDWGMTSSHPVLSGVAPVPGEPGAVVCQGYLSLDTLPWLVDHSVGGQSVLPATVLADLALSAGRESLLERPVLDELAIIKPLVLTAGVCNIIQVIVNFALTSEVGVADAYRNVKVYSRPQNAGVNRDWTQHATGTLRSSFSSTLVEANRPVQTWQAVDVNISGAYAALDDAGITYGQTFQCARTIWRSEDELFLRAELRLPGQASRPKSTSFFIHPALLDSALHVRALMEFAETPTSSMDVRLPFSLRGMQILRSVSDVESIFVITPTRKNRTNDGSFSLTIEDREGNLVAMIPEVVTRPWKPTLQEANLFRLEWSPVVNESIGIKPTRTNSESEVDTEDEIVHTRDLLCSYFNMTLPNAVHIASAHILETIQQWTLSSTFASGARLVVVTEKASINDPDLISTAIWGLIRSAQAEFGPERLVLVDMDGTVDSMMALPQALASGQGVVAVRDGVVMTPTLQKFEPMPLTPRATATLPPVNTSGTVLITGGTGALGALFARHLVRKYNAKSIVLLSRTGPNAPSAGAIIEDLSSMGATIQILICDITKRAEVSAVLGRMHPPVTAIIHTAGMLDDGTLSTQTAQRISSVLRPKVDGAWLLHQLAPAEAQLFLFSSAAGVLGNRGQAGYAAGNCFLDGLAKHRRVRGKHGLSLAWGPWENVHGMAGNMPHDGMLLSLSDRQGLDAFDSAVLMSEEEALILPLSHREGWSNFFSLSRDQQTTSFSKPPGKVHGYSSWRNRLATIESQKDRAAVLYGLVHDEVAQVLGHQPEHTLPNRSFADLGMDSFTAVQLRNKLSVLSGLKGLPPTLAFDANSLTALVEDLLSRFDESKSGDRMTRMTSSDDADHLTGINESKLTLTHSKIVHQPEQSATNYILPRDNALSGLGTLFRCMCQAGQYNAAAHILGAASLTLSHFTSSATIPARKPPRRLAIGSTAKPTLVVIPDFTPLTGETQSRYSSLAAVMNSNYDIYELPHPTVLVPDSLVALAELHADTVRKVFAGKRVILVGFSAGGCVAHAVAHQLLDTGGDWKLLVGLILIDTYEVSQDTTPEWLMRLALPTTTNMLVHVDPKPEEDEQLAVIGAYFRVIAGWKVSPLARKLQTLFVRAREAMPGADTGWRPAECLLADRTVEVPGHHLAILDERHVGAVVEAISEWVETSLVQE